MVLKSIGIGNPLLSWLYTYITGRKQFVKIKDAVSDYLWYHLVSLKVTPHLSPLLFILFVNSVTKWITKATLLLFSDDIKIFLIGSINAISYNQSSIFLQIGRTVLVLVLIKTKVTLCLFLESGLLFIITILLLAPLLTVFSFVKILVFIIFQH